MSPRRGPLVLLVVLVTTGVAAGVLAQARGDRVPIVDPGLTELGRAELGRVVERSGGLPRVLDGQVGIRWIVPGNAAATAALRELEYERVAAESDAGSRITVRSRDPIDGRRLTQRYVVRGDRVVEMQLEMPAGSSIELTAHATFIPAPLPGFGAVYGDVRPVMVDDEGQRDLEPGRATLDEFDWVGLRNRFSAVLLTGLAGSRIDIAIDRPNQPRVMLTPGAGIGSLTVRWYAGPVERGSLRAADPRLMGMLFAALWDWLRWLCFGMLWLLTAIDNVVGHIGWSIVLLSLSVKLLMTPLTMLADRLQASVNRTQALLQPKLADVKRNYTGEEAHERTLAVYREQGVSPLYTLKSLVGFLIQIPVFIAAFDMLGENIALQGGSFLWVADLAVPDRWLALPVALPFLGGYLNLLPCLMTGVTLLTSRLQTDPDLTPVLLRAQQKRLYWMAAAFFILFFTFPAGMVLYWTTNNVVHLVRIVVVAALDRSPDAG